MRSRTTSVLPLALLCVGLGLGLKCAPAPPQIVLPVHHAAFDVDLDPNVRIEFGSPLPATAIVSIHLVTGVDPVSEGEAAAPVLMDLTPRFGDLTGASSGSIALGETDLVEGRSTIFVYVDQDGDSVAEFVSSSTFSWEPGISLSDADRCDPLDPARCLLPFPNDHFTKLDAATESGRRVDFELESMPANTVGTHIDPTAYRRLDGFSPGAMLLAALEDFDPVVTGVPPISDIASSLDPDSPIVIIDAETGERMLFWSEKNDEAHNFPVADTPVLIIRPGKNFEHGRRYIVGLRGMKNSTGALIEPSRTFRVLRDGIPTYASPIEDRREHFESIFEALESAGVAREDLTLAWDFTVASWQSISGPLLHMRDDAFAILADEAPAFAITSVQTNVDANIWSRIRGTYQVPNYLEGTGETRSLLLRDENGMTKQSTEHPFFTALFRCVIPRSATADGNDPVVPARPSLYGHGLLGSESEVWNSSHVAPMANEHNFVFCATKWIGLSNEEESSTVPIIIGDASEFPWIPERLHQGMLNALFLGRLMIHPDGFASHSAFQAGAGNTSVIDPSELFYDGNSEGAIVGGAVTAIAQDWTRAVLGVAGMNYSTLLRRSVDFDQFLLFFNITYQDPIARTLTFAMLQMLWDVADTNGHAHKLTDDPYPDTPAHQILLHVAFGDFQVANVSAEVEARTIGAHAYQPALAPGLHWDMNPLFGIPPVVFDASDRFEGSALIYWDSGNAAPPNSNLPPRAGASTTLSACALDHDEDPHECPRRQPSARVQKSEFLSTNGAVIDVCNGAPCLAPDA